MQTQRATWTDQPEPVLLHVADADWRFTITAVTQIEHHLFVQILLQGPAVCTLIVHVSNGFVLGTTASDMLTRACEWLLTRGESTHGYIDLSSAHDAWVC